MVCCTSIMTVQRFRESFLVENSIHVFKKPEKVFAKTHCTHCLNAVPEHGSKIGQKHREKCSLALKIRARSVTKTFSIRCS